MADNVNINQEGNLIFQSYFIVNLLLNLKRNKFIESEYFKNMVFDFPQIKEQLKKTNIDNQGTVIIALYSMLVIPKETIEQRFPDEFKEINKKLNNYCQNTQTTYSSDNPEIKYIRHLRNAIAHVRISFAPNRFLCFEDNFKGQTFKSELPLEKIEELIKDLLEIHKKYLSSLRKK